MCGSGSERWFLGCGSRLKLDLFLTWGNLLILTIVAQARIWRVRRESDRPYKTQG